MVGGVDIVDNIRAYDPAFSPSPLYDSSNLTDRPLHAQGPIAPDPLQDLGDAVDERRRHQ